MTASTPSPVTDEMVERAARALAATFCDHWFGPDGIATKHKMTRDFVNGSDAWEAEARACLTAALDGMVVVPREPTAQMIAAAFPAVRGRPPDADMKIGAEAIMILEGGRDYGAITGSAVIEAASMCKDYRMMLAAATPPAAQGE